MIVKILKSNATFGAVDYNLKKVEDGRGELMYHVNFPIIGKTPDYLFFKNYLLAVSKINERIKSPQFHVAISGKEREYSKNQLTDISKAFMDKMGYGKQPYFIVFHKETNNNHVHIVSTRVGLDGNKISDKFEYKRAQKCLREIMKEKYGVDYDKTLKDLLKYKVGSAIQMRNLLEANGFNLIEQNGKFKIYQRGVFLQDIDIVRSQIDKRRIKELQYMFRAYSKEYNPIISKELNTWKSELSEFLKKEKNIDLIFHESKNKKVFGYTIIDNDKQNVIKGSEVFNVKNFFEVPENIQMDKDIQTDKNTNVDIDTNTDYQYEIKRNRPLGSHIFGNFFNGLIGSDENNNEDLKNRNNNKRKKKR